MKKIMGNTLLKFFAGLVCAALLLGTAWYGIWGVICKMDTPENITENVVRMPMYENTQAVLWYDHQLREILESEEPDWSQMAENERKLYDPSMTNFRFKVFRDSEPDLSTYNDEYAVAEYVYHEQVFLGSGAERRLLDAYENGRLYDVETDSYLPNRGHLLQEVEPEHNLPKDYVYYDEVGYLYDADRNLLARVENYAEVFGMTQDTAIPQRVAVDGTVYYPIDPNEGYPEVFAYVNEYGKIFDSNLIFITTMDEYHGGDWSTVVINEPRPTPTPTPQPVVDSTQVVVDDAEDALQAEPVIVPVHVLTEEEYRELYDTLNENVVIYGYVVMSDAVVTDTEGNPITPLKFAVEDQYSELYHRMMLLCTENGNELDLAVLCGLGALLLIFLMMAAGRRNTENGDEIVLRAIDRMPWDLWLCLVGGVYALALAGVIFGGELVQYESYSLLELILSLWALVAALVLAFTVWMLMSFAARVKVKGWWKNTLCGKVLFWAWKLCRKVLAWAWKWTKGFFAAMGRGIRGIPLIWKAVLVLGVLWLVKTVYVASSVWNGWAVVGILWNIVELLVCIAVCLMLKELQKGAKTIADGDLDYRIDLGRMVGDFKDHAACLNNIGEGLSRSVDEKLRSERMKTELITNVSHDLKTPLTSIVNYVDLLKKEELTGTAAEYVDVLDRQSARLKKLTEDLVEASKASSGALQVNLEWVSLTELLEQARAEYALRLETSGLQAIVNRPDKEVEVRADGRYVWRILDNLLSNVCKYAMPNTRVYLDLRTEGSYGVLSVKNISRECLNISAEELMERFVRGDSSRNTEGSGLGLSIALSLAKLMGGDLQLTVDGDLFKAEVRLPLAK